MALNDDIAGALTILGIDLLRYQETVRQNIILLMQDLEDDLIRQISAVSPGTAVRASTRYSRQEELLARVRVSIKEAYAAIGLAVTTELINTARIAAYGSASAVNDILQSGLFSYGLSITKAKALVSDALVMGAPMKEWWAKQAQDTALRTLSELRLGIALSETNDQIIERIIGKPTARTTRLITSGRTQTIVDHIGGVMNLSRGHAASLVLTAANTVSNAAFLEMYRENNDVLNGFALLVVLDGRTSDVCKARSGAAWDFDGNPLPQSRVKIKFPGPPPYHHKCRSLLSPIVIPWSEMLNLDPSIESKLTKKTQASMDGQVPAEWNYSDWLKTKSEAFQKQVLGEGRWLLWKANKLSLADLVDQRGRPIQYKVLKSKYGVP